MVFLGQNILLPLSDDYRLRFAAVIYAARGSDSGAFADQTQFRQVHDACAESRAPAVGSNCEAAPPTSEERPAQVRGLRPSAKPWGRHDEDRQSGAPSGAYAE